MERKKLAIDFTGPQGNTYFLLALVSDILRRQHRPTDFNIMRDKVFASKSYGEALFHINEMVKLEDTSKQLDIATLIKQGKASYEERCKDEF